MTSLLPSLQAADLRRALTAYLSTTFALTDDDVRTALEAFLADPDNGIFRGPYVRLRLPFRPADGTWSVPLDWYPPEWTPYGHQARAFERLSSKYAAPLPTLVTTGTGSGKTEAFLYPVIDHALRTRSAGQRGIKALILYPMNALANDQAGRIATLLSEDPRLGGLTAGLYTGVGGSRTKVSKDGLITDRTIMRDEPPDILLTNYKMLDQLLLRSDDVALWDGAPESLTYLVLDEFHTYDGAQGTDVAMLLRRLGAALGIARDGAPLGDVTPVATSATLGTTAGDTRRAGDTAGTEAMREFAATVFGRSMDPDAVITEDRVTVDQWQEERRRADAAARSETGDRVSYRPRDLVDAATTATAIRQAGPDPIAAINALIALVVERANRDQTELTSREVRRIRESRALSEVVTDHPLTLALLEHAQRPVALSELASALFPSDTSVGRADGVAIVDAYLGLLSLIRADLLDGHEARRFLGVDVQLWIREVSRVDRLVSSTPRFRWGDDGMAGYDAGLYQPAIYCRNCGRSGWGSLRSVTGSNLDTDAKSARQATLTGNDRYRALIFAGGEAAAVDQSGGSVTVDGLYWLDLRSREVLAESPSDDDEELRHVPVLTDWDGRFRPRDEVCPSCQQKDSIRFLGTRSSTLASVSLNALFGSESLESAEKKTLLFTDSVQDAAYTAGFVQARSHTMSRRSVVRSALSSDPMPLPDVAADMMAAAGEDPHARYALIPPELADRKRFARYWTMEGDRREERAARHAVKARLDFDLALEFGLQSRTGRTLELTGSAVAEVDVGTSDRLRRAAAEALSKAREQHSFSPEFDELLGVGIDATLVSGWARGVLERMRVQGGVHHPWLDAYLRSDGNRWFLLGGRRRRDRDDGMPAFPRGRPSPAFPTTSAARESLDSVTGHASWYARWAVRQLGTTPRDGGVITGAFLARAAQEGWLTETATDSGARVYRIPPDLVVVHIPGDGALADGEHALRCYVCHTVTPGSQATITDLDGAACLRQGCPGRLHRHALAADYYRELYDSSRIRRVVAREHTSLLPDKVRLEHEEAFKSGRGPNVPNVLAATPTLELGIDIGDLSTVMLGSLPREVASYQQRVGRAGRLTGNALVLGYVRGRGQNLQRLNEPTSLIDGEIRPPATYLDAIEILQRQYVAFLIDQRVRSGVPDPPSGRGATRQVLASGWDTGTWIGDLLSDARIKANEYTSRFLGLFGNLVAPDTAATLRAWAGVELPDNEVSGVEHIFQSAIRSYQHELDDLGRRSGALADSLPELIQAAERATATDEDQRNRRAAEAEQRALDMRRAALRGQYWINALEERGVLPNYTLLDDTVQLDVSLRWYDHDTGDFHHEPQTYQRGASVALTDFAPGATFYAQSVAIAIDAVDVGPGLDMVRERWIVCARCGWSVAEQATVGPPSQACPRCGDAAVRDVGQRLDVIPLERVSAEVFRDEALISDGNDDRVQTSFSVVPLVDVDPARVSGAWRLDGYPFGAEYVRECLVRWVNLGLAQRSGSERVLAGNEIRAPLFRVCPACGVVPSAQRRDENEARHRGWCPHRRDLDIDWQTVALGRSLRTQAVQLLIPPHFTRDTFAGASFRAALLLGLREVIGGAPDHLDVVEAHAPVDGQDRIVLVLHDTVPGGTGYLADFARPSRVHDVLSAALDVLSTCSCREEQVLACHRCLMPFAPPQMVEHTSRARAEQLLREILDSGRENAGASDDSPWSVTEISSLTDVVLESTESHLEQRFRATLVDALRARGADIREEPHVDGTVVHIGVPGDMRRQWALRPQPRLHGTRPDFVLMTEDTSVPAMYIYTDGRRFHSHPRANNLADDAEKRAILRQAGHVVWAVTTADLDAFEARTEGAAVPPPTWFTDHVRTNLARLRGRELVSAGSVGDDVITADAVTQILTWVANPEPARWRSLASILPLAFMDQNRREWNLERLPGVVLAALAGAPAPPTDPGGLAGWWWQDSTCVIAAATPAPPALDITTILAVDDTSAALEADESGAAWRTWLALSNILGFAARPPLITTQSLLAGPAVSHPPRAVDYTFTPPDDTVAVVSPAWQSLFDTAVDEIELRVLRALAEAGVPLPEQGHETGTGVTIDIAWPNHRVAVVFSPVQGHELAGEGWTVAGLWDDDLPARVKTLLGTDTTGGG